MKYRQHYHNLDKLHPVITKLKNKEPVFISYIGNSNCALVKEDGYHRIWAEMLTAELNCYFSSQYTFGTVLGLAGQRWSEVLRQREVLLDHLPADLVVAYCGMRINYAKDYTEYISDLEKVLEICAAKSTVLAVTSMPMLAIDQENRRLKNELWECPEHLEKHEQTRELIINKLNLPCVDLYSIWKEMHESDEMESTDFIERSDSAHPGILGQFMVARTVRKAFAPRYESIWWGGGGR
jgi:hypothetical protein